MKLGPIQKKWIKTLKQHPERQTTGQLGIIEYGEKKMCCLGQGGLIVGVCKWKGRELVLSNGKEDNGFLLYGYKRLGLRDEEGAAKSTEMEGGMPPLGTLNDEGFDWPHIAAILETFPEEYFTKSV